MPEPSAPPVIDARAVVRMQHRLARADAAPWLHQEVARRMAERLPIIKQPPRRWLDWGGLLGGGRAEVTKVWPQAACTVVEPDDVLAERSRQTLRGPWWRGRRALSPVRLADEVPEASGDMLWANMVLHADPAPQALLQRWHRALAVGGFAMFSTLGPDTLAELRALYAEAGWPAPHPPFADMHDIGDALVHAGFADPVMDQERLNLHWSTPEALLADLRAWGQHLGSSRFDALRTPRWQRELCARLGRLADAQGRIGLCFEVVYGHAYKAAPPAPRSETTLVALDAVRATLPRRRSGAK